MFKIRNNKHVIKAALLCLSIGMTHAAQASETIALPGEALFPEGIASDSAGGLYVGSLIQGRILYLEPSSKKPRIFAPDGVNGLMAIGGLIVSPDGKTLFACNSDLGFGPHSGASSPGLVSFDTKSGAFKKRWAFPNGGLCNDLTMTPDGSILLTDSFVPRILVLKPGAEALEEWVTNERFTGEGFNLNGITWSKQGVFAVKYNSNELFRIGLNADGSAGKVDPVNLSRPLGGPDGIKTLATGELLVVEGQGRLAKIKINGLDGSVETIAEGLNVPTTATVVGQTVYVVEGQLDHLPTPDSEAGAPEPFTLKVLDLP